MGFWQELRRRHVYRMSGFYIVGAWLIIQVADVFFPAWGLPETALRFLIIAAILCFPIALVFSWTYDITASGIVKTEPAEPGEVFDNSLKRSDYIVLIALLVTGAAIVFSSLQKIVEEVDDGVVAAEKIANSVAVLPFENLDTNPDTGYFSDGVTEEILHRLSSLKALHILSRASSFAFRDSNEGHARISEILGVRYLLHGSVRRDNDLVRVTARLIDDTGYQVWSETFDRKLEGIFAIQSEIANTVASRIEREIIPSIEDAIGSTTTNMAAYDAYLVGRAFVNARTPGWDDKAIAAFEEAIRLDENFAPPYAGLAIASSINNPDYEDVRESILRAAETAIELDPELAEGHAALGLMRLNNAPLFDESNNELERAERSLRRALELDPSLSIAYSWLSSTLREQDRYDEANVVREQGLQIDPLNPVMSYNVALGLWTSGEAERAEQLLLRLTHLPEPPWTAYSGLFRLYLETGEFDQALHWVKQYALADSGSDNPGVSAFIAGCYERLGLTEDADYWVADVLARTSHPVQRFMYKSAKYRFRGDPAGLREEIDKLETALGPEIDQLHPFHAGRYGSANILAGNFTVGIDVLENAYDFESMSFGNDTSPFSGRLELPHILAWAYQQVGRDDEANVLLNRLHKHLNVMIDEQNTNYGELHQLRALNVGLRGDFDAAADALEAAIEVGWLRYTWVMGNPMWTDMIAYPRISRMLADVKIELDRQRVIVEQVDAEHDFRAELEVLRSTPDRADRP